MSEIQNDDRPAGNGSSAAQPTKRTVRIGTRVSILARVQTDIVAKALREAYPGIHCEIVGIKPLGDQDKITALYAFNAKALWTTELEEQLAQGNLDMIVHSLKDMPTQLPDNMTLGAILEREDPRDALCVHPSLSDTHKTLASLPAGSVIGTSSLRRMAQLKRAHPHLEYTDCRGNVGTRLGKLDAPDSGIAALILAAAGLHRLGMHDRITSYLSSQEKGMLHAVGQGAIGVEIRSDDGEMQKLLEVVGDEWTTRQCLAERALMRALEGGCSVPIGIESHWMSRAQTATSTGVGGVGARPFAQYDQVSGVAVTGPEPVDRHGDAADRQPSAGADVRQEEQRSEELFLKAIVVSLDGQEAVEREISRRVSSREDADELGLELARALVEGGAGKILEAITLNRKIVEEQHNA